MGESASINGTELEILLEILSEFLLQALGEILLELGLHALAEPFRKAPDPWLAAAGYLLFGALFGGLSLLFFQVHLTTAGPWRILNLIVTPIAVGFCMMAMGAWRRRRGQTIFRIDRFAYGYLFALALAAVRFRFAQ